MSIQSKIDLNLSEEGREFYSFVIKGESGDANIPENVHIRFYGCTIGTLTMNGGNGVFIEGGSVSSVSAKNGRLMSRGTTYSGDADLDGCSADLFGGSSTGKWALKSRSHLRTDNFSFSSADIAVDMKGGSRAKFTRTTFSGHATAAVQADEASYAYLGKCDSIKATKAALWAKEKSTIEAVECLLVQGVGQNAAKAEKSGRINLLNCLTVKGNTDALMAETKAMISVAKCQTVVGDGGAALKLDSEARADIRSCQNVTGKGASALILLDTNELYVADVQTLFSQAADAIEAKNTSKVEIVSVDNVTGQGGNAVTASSKSVVSLLKVKKAVGQGGDGVKAEGESRVSLSDVEELTGQSGNAVSLSGESRFDAHSVKKLQGQAGHGVDASQGCVIILKNIDELTGSSGHGVSISQDCRAILLTITKITGSSGDGVTGSNDCTIQMSGCRQVIGSSGVGVKLVNGKALHISGSDEITGSSSHGIQAEDAVVRIQNVAKVTGQGDGIKLTNCDFRSQRLEVVEGQDTGFSAVGRGPAEDMVDIQGQTNINGSNIGISLESVRAFTKGLSVNGEIALKFSGAQHESRIDQFNGDADLEDGVLSFFESRITGKLDASNTVLLDLRGSLGSESKLNAVAAVLAGSNLASGEASGTGLVGARATIGSMDMDDVGIGVFGGSAALEGTGSAVLARAGTPGDSVDYVAVEPDTIRTQNESGTFVELNGDDITSKGAGDYEIDMEGNYKATVEGNYEVEAQGNYSVDAQGNVDVTCQGSGTWTAQSSLTLEGQASIKVTSSGVATVSGSLIMHE